MKSDGGTVIVKTSRLEAGGVPDVDFKPEYGRRVGKIKVTNLVTGEEMILDNLMGFRMPAADVKIEAQFLPIEYTVTFISAGEVISSARLRPGDVVTPPEMPISFEKDGYLYEFLGWTPRISEVTGDAEYTARYSVTLITDRRTPGESSALKLILKTLFIPAACVIAGVTAAVLAVPTIRIRLRKKKSK